MSVRKRLFQATDTMRPLLAGQALLSLALTACVIGQMILLSVVVHDAFMAGGTLTTLQIPLALLAALIVLRAGLIRLHQIVSQRGAIRIKLALRSRLLHHLYAVGPAHLQRERTGELTRVIMDGPERIDAYFSRYLPRALHVAIAPLCIAIFVASIDLLSGLLLLCTGPLIPVFMWLIGSMAKERTQKQWAAMSRMSAHFLDVLQGLTTLKLFGRARDQVREIRQISNRYRLTTMGVLKVAFLSGMVLELAASLSTAIVAVQIGVRLVEGHIAFQPGLLVLLLAPEFYLPFRQLGTEHHAAMEGTAAAERIFEVLDAPTLPEPSAPVSLPEGPADLHLEQVRYQYPGRDQPALDTCSAVIRHGQVTALVGPSGAGKSTIFHIMCRFVDPCAGQMRIGEVNLLDVPRTVWRERVAWVSQAPALFNGTVRDTIRMARPTAIHAEVEAAARLAEAHDFIQRLPNGYDTVLGEQAWRLSGGERQRLAVARAFLKDAPILLMDEPTANLDPDSEEKLAVAFERLANNRTVLVIAHRLRTVYRADHILVMDQGRIVESGVHDDLLDGDGVYARLMGGTP